MIAIMLKHIEEWKKVWNIYLLFSASTSLRKIVDFVLDEPLSLRTWNKWVKNTKRIKYNLYLLLKYNTH